MTGDWIIWNSKYPQGSPLLKGITCDFALRHKHMCNSLPLLNYLFQFCVFFLVLCILRKTLFIRIFKFSSTKQWFAYILLAFLSSLNLSYHWNSFQKLGHNYSYHFSQILHPQITSRMKFFYLFHSRCLIPKWIPHVQLLFFLPQERNRDNFHAGIQVSKHWRALFFYTDQAISTFHEEHRKPTWRAIKGSPPLFCLARVAMAKDLSLKSSTGKWNYLEFYLNEMKLS